MKECLVMTNRTLGGTRRNVVILCLLVLYTVGPILSLLLAAGIAHFLDCGDLSYSGYNDPCNCFGVDIGPLLLVMGMMAWLALLTLPTGSLATLGFLLYALISARKKRPELDEH